jgi:hypothetical protein
MGNSDSFAFQRDILNDAVATARKESYSSIWHDAASLCQQKLKEKLNLDLQLNDTIVFEEFNRPSKFKYEQFSAEEVNTSSIC